MISWETDCEELRAETRASLDHFRQSLILLDCILIALVTILAVCDENADQLFSFRFLIEHSSDVLEYIHKVGTTTCLNSTNHCPVLRQIARIKGLHLIVVKDSSEGARRLFCVEIFLSNRLCTHLKRVDRLTFHWLRDIECLDEDLLLARLCRRARHMLKLCLRHLQWILHIKVLLINCEVLHDAIVIGPNNHNDYFL